MQEHLQSFEMNNNENTEVRIASFSNIFFTLTQFLLRCALMFAKISFIKKVFPLPREHQEKILLESNARTFTIVRIGRAHV